MCVLLLCIACPPESLERCLQKGLNQKKSRQNNVYEKRSNQIRKGQKQKNEFRRAWPYEETQKDDGKIKLPNNSGRAVQYQYQYQ